MKSRKTLASFAFVLAASSLVVVACQDDGNGGGGTIGVGGSSNGGSSSNAGGTSAGKSQAGTSNGGTSNAGTNTGGTGSSIDCSDASSLGDEKTLVELNKATLPLPDRIHVSGVVATSHKVLISPSKSGCLWGVYVTTEGADIAEYGSILVTSKGKAPIADENGKYNCTLTDQDTVIPSDVKPGDKLDLSGYVEEFLQNACDGTTNPKPAAGQRQIGGASCMTKTGEVTVPKAHALSNEVLSDIAAGTNTDDVMHKFGGAPVEISGVTPKLLSTEKYFNCSAVSGFGDLVFNETSITVNNNAFYSDVTCAGPKDSNKRYDFATDTQFTSIVGLLAVDFCTWQVSVADRCDAISPQSPTCALLTNGDKCSAVKNATSCPPENTAEQCNDGIDNNGNSFIDCDEAGCCDVRKDCAATTYCGKKANSVPENTLALCSDGVDNDVDNFIDCEDKDCCSVRTDCKTAAPDSYCGKGGTGSGGSNGGGSENTLALCTDGTDNDGDKFTDCDDYDCCDVADCKNTKPQSKCATKGSGGSGGSGGSSGTPENTLALCSDNTDNDGDTFIDCNDSGCCSVRTDCKTAAPDSFCGKKGVENTLALCSDNTDNDGDKFTDCDDKDCCAVRTDCKTAAPTSYCGTH